jgi:hypothetical protein
MREIKTKKGETRKDYLLRVSLAYLEEIENSAYRDALGTMLKFDEAECDGHCLIDDINLEINQQ